MGWPQLDNVRAYGFDKAYFKTTGNADLPYLLSDYHLLIYPAGQIDEGGNGLSFLVAPVLAGLLIVGAVAALSVIRDTSSRSTCSEAMRASRRGPRSSVR